MSAERYEPERCGWHEVDVRDVAVAFRRFELPDTNVPTVVWVVSGSGQVPGVSHSRIPAPRVEPSQ